MSDVNLTKNNSLETLRLSTTNIHGRNVAERIVCAVKPEDKAVPKDTALLMLIHFGPDSHRVDTLRVYLNREEIDALIKGLQNAKKILERP